MGHLADISPVWLIFVAPQRRLHRKMAVFWDFRDPYARRGARLLEPDASKSGL